MSFFGKRRRSSACGKDHRPRYPEYTSVYNQEEQAMFHNPPPPTHYSHQIQTPPLEFTQPPPPPLNFSQPPPQSFSYQPPFNPNHLHQYPDPQGVSPPTTPLTPGISILDQSDHSGSRPGSSLSQVSTPGILYSPSVSTTSGNSYSKCSFCSLVFSSVSLATHLSSCHSHLMFHCTLCSVQFLGVSQLRSHMFSRHTVNTFSCDKLAMAGTITLPTDLRLYRCKKCPTEQGTFYGSGPHLVASHLASHHPDVTGSASKSQMVGYECRACHNYQLEGESQLLKHIELRHSKAREPSVEVVTVPTHNDSVSQVNVTPDSVSLSPDQVCDTSLPADLTRCNMCPSPGLVHKDQVDKHLRGHNTMLFTCAPCKKKFEMYQEVEHHIRAEHKVSNSSTILESIILPNSSQLVTLQCGVCSRQFVGQGEQVLVSHIESTHGKFYVGVGRGKNIVRLCRLCGQKSTDGGEMVKHLDTHHDLKLFANDSDSENTHEEDTEQIPSQITSTTKTTSTRVAFMDIFKEEVARRKAEYDKQALEKKKLVTVHSSDSVSDSSSSSSSEIDNADVAREKKSSSKHKKRKASKKKKKIKSSRPILHSSDSETNFSEDFVHSNKHKRIYSDDKKRKLVIKDKHRDGHKGRTNLNKSKKRLTEPSSDSDESAVAYKYYKKKSRKDDLKRYKYSKANKSKSATKKVNLKQSSTEKLLEAKEMIRVSIQKEEIIRQVQGKKISSLVSCDGQKTSDLAKLKEQLSETLKRSKELTKKMNKKYKSQLSIVASKSEETLDEMSNRDTEVNADLFVASESILYDQELSSESHVSAAFRQLGPSLSTDEPKSSKFKMTWKR